MAKTAITLEIKMKIWREYLAKNGGSTLKDINKLSIFGTTVKEITRKAIATEKTSTPLTLVRNFKRS